LTGLDPVIHVFSRCNKDVDDRVKPGHGVIGRWIFDPVAVIS